MEPKIVKAQCIEAVVEDGEYVECFMRRGKGAESVAIYLMPGEWLARHQEYDNYADCGLTIASYVAMALLRGKVATYDDEVSIHKINCEYTVYVFKKSGHIVVVRENWEGWHDYVGTLSMPLEDLLEYVRDRYDGEVRRVLEDVVREAKAVVKSH